MRGMFHRHLAATAVTLAAIGGASAQSSVILTSQHSDTSPSATSTISPTTEPAAAPAAAPETKPATGADLLQAPIAETLQGNDAAIAEKLRELLATKLNRVIERKQDRGGVEAFYRDRGFAPLWIADGKPSDRAKTASALLRGVGADGLDPADYPVPDFSGDADKLAQDEIALTQSVLAFARHARSGRISFSRVSSAIFYELEFPQAADVLANMANASDTTEALGAYHPQHAAYKALKSKLAEARKQTKSALVDTLLANMERWRWMPRDLGKSYVTVNIPDYTLAVTDQGKTVWSTRIVVGKVGAQATPLISETMKFITVNPTWNVPPSIIRNEYLPALLRDPNALARIGLKLTHNKDGSIRIYQPPGERNALGRIRFNFPNKFLVYQHDTPQKHLFDQAQRAYSHGCMRVQHPEQYAEVLLSIALPAERYTAERIKKMYGDKERTINFKTQIPVHLTYQTAFVDSAGQLQTRPDIYGHDRKITELMRNGRSAVDTPVARNYNSSSKPVVARSPSRDYQPQPRRSDSYFDGGNDRVARRYDPFAFTPPGYIAPMPYFFGPPASRRSYGIPY
jgi:murein L,D-transpeptidase YcbB/YkuD